MLDAENGRGGIERRSARHHGQDVGALDGFHAEVSAHVRAAFFRARYAFGKCLRLQARRWPEDDGAFDGVAKLAYVAGPGVVFERLLGRW